MQKISEVLESYRLHAGKGGMPLSYAELGRRIGVSRTQAENFCKGRSIPSDEAVLRICRETGEDEFLLLVLQHHDRAPEPVKPAWREIMGRLQNSTTQLPTTDPKIMEILQEYIRLPHAGRAAFLKLATLFTRLKTEFQDHLVSVVGRWVDSQKELERQLGGAKN